MQQISIVIPALNEEQGIKKTLDSIPHQKLRDLGYEVQVIVVDNASEDSTSDVAAQSGATVILQPKRGYGHAYKAGFAAANGSWLISSDADGTYPISQLDEILSQLDLNNLDFVTTNRFKQEYFSLHQMPFINRVGNKFLSLLTQFVFDFPVKDSQSGMWIFRKNLYDKMIIRSNGMGFSQEIKIEAIKNLHSRWIEIDINYAERIGKKKLNVIKDGFLNLCNLLAKRLRR